MNANRDVEWIPPQHLDTGQARVNDYHRPERLRPPNEELFVEPVVDELVVDEPGMSTDEEVSTSIVRQSENEWFDEEWLYGPPDYEPSKDNLHEPGGPEPNAA
jgi:hypothetical protein